MTELYKKHMYLALVGTVPIFSCTHATQHMDKPVIMYNCQRLLSESKIHTCKYFKSLHILIIKYVTCPHVFIPDLIYNSWMSFDGIISTNSCCLIELFLLTFSASLSMSSFWQHFKQFSFNDDKLNWSRSSQAPQMRSVVTKPRLLHSSTDKELLATLSIYNCKSKIFQHS